MFKGIMAAALFAVLGGCMAGGAGKPAPVERSGHDYFITGWGLGDMRKASAGAWEDAKHKLEMSGLKGYALVEEETIHSSNTGELGIRFRLVPAPVMAGGGSPAGPREAEDPEAAELRRERQAAEMQLDRLRDQGMGENHPAVKKLRAEIEAIEKRMAERTAEPQPAPATNASS